MSNPIATLKAKSLAASVDANPATAGLAPSVADPLITGPQSLPDIARDKNGDSWPAAEPCTACGSPGFWLDVYDGLHCRGCDPPTTPSLVRTRLWVVGSDGAPDRLRWSTLLDERASQAKQQAGEVRHVMIDRGDGRSNVTAIAWPDRIDTLRMPNLIDGELRSTPWWPARRYSPSLGCAPVGDMTIDEWWEMLPHPQSP